GTAEQEVGGAEVARERLLLGERVEGDDAARTLGPRGLDDVEADAADTDDGAGVAETELGAVPHRADAGEHTAADQARDREVDVVGHLHALVRLDEAVLGEERRPREVPRRLP